MSPWKVFSATVTLFLALYCTGSMAATFTSCYEHTCAIITVPEHVAPGEEFEIQVEGYVENATSWDTSAYMLLENASWHYDSSHMISFTGETIDSKGFHWGGDLVKKYKFKNLKERKVLTFVFGSRSWGHGYYDVAVDATIEATLPAIQVAFDIKPQSCPNPIHAKQKGLLSAAIVGSPEFDVTQVAPDSIQLAGVRPIHISYGDVTAPFDPFTTKVTATDCTDAGPDSYLDLTMKFRTQDVYRALQNGQGAPLGKGETLTVNITGFLSEAAGQNARRPISGEDVVRINAKQ